MNAVLGLSHFCETHGPTVLFSTQAFHFVGESESGILQPFGTRFFGCVKKLGDYNAGLLPSVNVNVACEACESVSGYVTNDYKNKISFLSTKLAVDPNVSSLLKQAAVRSLSCEIVPGKEGQVYFGDPVRGHVLSNTFFLKDAQARGFHRWYSVVVFMRDKHFLLNSWAFFQKHISKLITQLQKKADEVYTEEQTKCSQRAFRLTSLDQKHSVARSLVKLTASINIFVQLHLWFTWLLSIGAQRLEEHLPTKALDCTKLHLGEVGGLVLVKESEEVVKAREDPILCLRHLRQIFGVQNFQKVLYSTLIGQQIVVRGPKNVVDQIIGLLKLFLPAEKFRCQEFGETYKTPDICNIVGLDLCAAVPKSCEAIIRLDIVPNRDADEEKMSSSEGFKHYHFLVKTERELPKKLPSLLVKIDKTLSDESLTNRVALLHITSLLEKWVHLAEVVQEAKKRQAEFYFTGLMQYLGIPDQDEQLIEFWTS